VRRIHRNSSLQYYLLGTNFMYRGDKKLTNNFWLIAITSVKGGKRLQHVEKAKVSCTPIVASGDLDLLLLVVVDVGALGVHSVGE
jgi:hypothetical protein